jgi:flagellar L-ring protein precursor FlgH
LVTIAISERASALTSGSLTQSRSSSSDSAVANLFGVMAPLGGLPNLFNQESDSRLDGSGSTGRQMSVTAVVTAHVVEVMPNGNLIIEGIKEISVNAERQLVIIRGVVRQADLRTDNSVSSDRVALLDLRVNGKGVVNEAIHRPNALYRIFRRLLPF